MQYILYTSKILLFFLTGSIIYLLSSRIKQPNIIIKTKTHRYGNDKISVLVLLVVCIIYGIVSLAMGGAVRSDRVYYINKFVWNAPAYYQIEQNSTGLHYIYTILHKISYNPAVLIFTVAFLYLLINLIAYNKSDIASPFALILSAISMYFTYGFYVYKQGFAIAFVALATIVFLRGNKIGGYLLLIPGILFHETAFIAIPVFLAMTFRNRRVQYLFSVILALIVIFFPYLNDQLINLTRLIPFLYNQLTASSFLSESGNSMMLDYNYLTAFKGLPIYAITFWGIRRKHTLAEGLPTYYNYIFLCVMTSLMIFAGTYMYWLVRFAWLFYFPVFCFASYLYKETKGQRTEEDSNLIYIIVSSLFVFTMRELIMQFFLYGGF